MTSSVTHPGANETSTGHCASVSKTPRPSDSSTEVELASAPRPAALRPPSKSPRLCLPDTRPYPTVLGSITSAMTGVPSLLVSLRTCSPRQDGAIPTPARRGTSTYRPASSRCRYPAGSVPDSDPAVWVQKQRIVFGDVKGVVKGVHVTDDAIAAELRRRVRIHCQPPDRFRFTGFGPPHLGPAVEHALHAGEAVDDGSGAAVQRQLVGQQCDGQPAQVADVLPDGECAIHVVAGV